jgi:hypothetical protein
MVNRFVVVSRARVMHMIIAQPDSCAVDKDRSSAPASLVVRVLPQTKDPGVSTEYWYSITKMLYSLGTFHWPT